MPGNPFSGNPVLPSGRHDRPRPDSCIASRRGKPPTGRDHPRGSSPRRATQGARHENRLQKPSTGDDRRRSPPRGIRPRGRRRGHHRRTGQLRCPQQRGRRLQRVRDRARRPAPRGRVPHVLQPQLRPADDHRAAREHRDPRDLRHAPARHPPEHHRALRRVALGLASRHRPAVPVDPRHRRQSQRPAAPLRPRRRPRSGSRISASNSSPCRPAA